MATYLVGSCKGCGTVKAAAVRTVHDSEADWQKTADEFREGNLSVTEMVTEERVTVHSCCCKNGNALELRDILDWAEQTFRKHRAEGAMKSEESRIAWAILNAPR